MSERKCKGSNAKGAPCGAPPLSSSDWCSSHDPDLPDEARFGSAAQAAIAGASPKPRAIKFREAAIAAVEREADSLVARWLEGTNATRAQAIGSGDDLLVEQVPDYPARLRALADLWDRTVGKPGQEIELTGKDGGPIRTSNGIDLAGLSDEELELLERIQPRTSE